MTMWMMLLSWVPRCGSCQRGGGGGGGSGDGGGEGLSWTKSPALQVLCLRKGKRSDAF